MARKSKWPKRVLLLLVAAGAAAAVALSLKPDPIPVQVSRSVRGPLLVTVDGTGRTRLVNKQTLAAPVIGELAKITLRPGDRVAGGQLVAEILPSIPSPLDARTKAEIVARLGSAQASLQEAQRNVERAAIALELAEKQAERNRQLLAAQAIPPQALELTEAEAKARRSELELARTTVERIRRDSTVLAATLRDPNQSSKKAPQSIELRAPGDGVVLRVHQESAGPVQPGTPLLDIGDFATIELVVDLPTQSAMKVKAGAVVRIDGLGSDLQLTGRVKLVEPAAFTKVTALGVEEQRANVIVTPAGDVGLWASLGDGFAADAHIEVHRAENVVKLPLGAVFREGSHTATFCVQGDRVRLTRIETGGRSADEVEVGSGLPDGATVVVHPSDKLTDGAVVRVE